MGSKFGFLAALYAVSAFAEGPPPTVAQLRACFSAVKENTVSVGRYELDTHFHYLHYGNKMNGDAILKLGERAGKKGFYEIGLRNDYFAFVPLPAGTPATITWTHPNGKEEKDAELKAGVTAQRCATLNFSPKGNLLSYSGYAEGAFYPGACSSDAATAVTATALDGTDAGLRQVLLGLATQAVKELPPSLALETERYEDGWLGRKIDTAKQLQSLAACDKLGDAGLQTATNAARVAVRNAPAPNEAAHERNLARRRRERTGDKDSPLIPPSLPPRSAPPEHEKRGSDPIPFPPPVEPPPPPFPGGPFPGKAEATH